MDNYSVCYAAMTAISKTVKAFGISSLGINQDDFNKTTGDAVWMSADKPVAVRTLQQLAFGVMDAQSLPRFDMPAEYLAGIIALYVKPANQFAACAWLAGEMLNVDLAVRGEAPESFSASRLYSLVLLASSKDLKAFCNVFGKATKKKLDKALDVDKPAGFVAGDPKRA